MRRVVRSLLHPVRTARELRARLLARVPEPEPRRMRDAQDYWGESAESAERRDLSHWRGVGRWTEEEWLAVGSRTLERFRRLASGAGGSSSDERIGTLLEWGPGGGANAVAFAPLAERIVGVDLSEANLAECARQVAATGHAAFVPLRIDAERPESVAQALPKGVDAVLSTAVFQHFPSAAYGARVLEVLARVLKPGGRGLVQVRYDDGTPEYRPKQRDYARNAVTFTACGVEAFWRLLEEKGFAPLGVELEPSCHYAHYGFVRLPSPGRGPAAPPA